MNTSGFINICVGTRDDFQGKCNVEIEWKLLLVIILGMLGNKVLENIKCNRIFSKTFLNTFIATRSIYLCGDCTSIL